MSGISLGHGREKPVLKTDLSLHRAFMNTNRVSEGKGLMGASRGEGKRLWIICSHPKFGFFFFLRIKSSVTNTHFRAISRALKCLFLSILLSFIVAFLQRIVSDCFT